jgi:hypothetical protein
MARAPKNANLSRATHLPWDKEGALPIPAGTAKARRARPSSTRGAAGEQAQPAAGRRSPPVREEYPGPQTSSDGNRVEPGRVQPSRRRTH